MPCKERKARIVNKTLFTIQLIYGSSGYKQEITLGRDTGSKYIRVSAVTDKKELYTAEIKLRTDIVDLVM